MKSSSVNTRTATRTAMKLVLVTHCLLLWSIGGAGGQEEAARPACPPADNAACACTVTSNKDMELQCDKRALQRVPTNKPQSTKVINLAYNQLDIIYKDDFKNLEEVRTLFLQFNTIRYIEPGTFDNLYSLELLVLSDNRLGRIPDNMFQHLPSITSIDLRNNSLNKINKRAFLTLPAAKRTGQSPGIIIRLKDNRLNCDCDALALRNWKDSLAGMDKRLTPVKFDGFQCHDKGLIDLDSLNPDLFPPCTNIQQSAFPFTQTCASCQKKPTQYSCDLSGNSTCQDTLSACQSEVRVQRGKVVMTKSCSAYSTCLLESRKNSPQCLSSSGQSLACTFCCVGRDCVKGDFGGRTISFGFFVRLQSRKAFEDHMLLPNDARYVESAQFWEQTISGIFLQLDGGYHVDFLSFRNKSGLVSVTTLAHVTQLSSVTLADAARMVLQALNASMLQGSLSSQRISDIRVNTSPGDSANCIAEVTPTAQGKITWQETAAGRDAVADCPQFIGLNARRRCVEGQFGVAHWEPPNLEDCRADHSPGVKSTTTPRPKTTALLEELTKGPITPANVHNVLSTLNQLTSDGWSLSSDDVSLALSAVERSLGEGGGLQDQRAMNSTVNVLSNLMDAREDVLEQASRQADSASKLLKAAELVSSEGELSDGDQLMLTSANLVLAAKAVQPDSFKGLTLSADPNNGEPLTAGQVKVTADLRIPTGSVNRLTLPSSLLTSSPGSRLAMTVHRSDKIFEAAKHSQKAASTSDDSAEADFVTKVNSQVLSASVVGRNITDLRNPIVFTLLHDNENSTKPRCVFWDAEELGWSSRGCRKVDSLSDRNSTTCQCDHLTNFALLMDVYGSGEFLSEGDRKILSIISYIGCGVSLLALLLTLLTYILFKKLRRDNPSKILVNLCLALALSNLIFVAGMHPYALDNDAGCKVVAVLLHFSLLSSLCWMLVEAFYMYLALVLVFKTYFTNFILKCSLVGWGVPLLIVILTLAINETENYGALNTGVCWLRGLSFYISFVGPVCLILAANFLAFGLVLRQIMGLSARKLNRNDSFSTSQQLRGIVGVAILLGLTWIFAVFAIDRASLAFHYLFAIFNSLQGLWIFLFYCLLKKEARNSWLRALPCCETPDDRSVISSSKGYSGAGAVRYPPSVDRSSQGGTQSTLPLNSNNYSDLESEGTYVNGHVSRNSYPHHAYENVSLTPASPDPDHPDNKDSLPPPYPYTLPSVSSSYRPDSDVNYSSPTSNAHAPRSLQCRAGSTESEPDRFGITTPRPLQFRSGSTESDPGRFQTQRQPLQLQLRSRSTESSPEKTHDALLRRRIPQAGGSVREEEEEGEFQSTRSSFPRPLHFTPGHTHCVERKVSETDVDLSLPPTPLPQQEAEQGEEEGEGGRGHSVADMIKVFNIRL